MDVKKPNLRNQKSKIAKRFQSLNLLLITLVVVLVLLIAVFIIVRADRDNSRKLAVSFSTEAVHKLNTFLTRDLVLVQKASASSALVDWFTNEKDQGKWEIAYNEIMDYIYTFHDMRIFFGILDTNNDLMDTHDIVPSQFLPFYRLYLDIPDHADYFNCINTDKGYNFSIDIDNFTKSWQLWINHRVMADGKSVGIVCSHRPINDLFISMFPDRSQSGFMGYIIDKHGNVLMDTAFIKLYGDQIIDEIHDADNDPALVAAIAKFPVDSDSCFLQDLPSQTVSLTKGNYKYAALTPVPDTEWTVAFFYNYKYLSNLNDIINLLPVFLGMILVLIFYSAGRNALSKEMIFTPLSRLTQSVSENNIKKFDLYGIDRNDEIGILARTVSEMRDSLNAQALEVSKANEQTQKLFNAMPISCMLWNREVQIFDCNDESLRMFNLDDKHDFLNRFYSVCPEYQPTGETSRELALTLIKRAFEDGFCTFKWTHQLLDGTIFPTEVMLVRVVVGEEPIVAAYVRDLRDYEIMVNEIVSQDNLLNTVNNIASILLQSEPDQFEKNLIGCMGMMARVIDVDRVYLWKNFSFEGKLYCSPLYEWPETSVVPQSGFLKKTSAYTDLPGWEEKLSKRQSINAIISRLPADERKNFESQGIRSILILPIFLDDKFWGFVGFDEMHHERLFTENEESILRSGNLLIATSMQRNEMTRNLRYTSTQLESALEKASKASRAKSDFLANMSHEMRTPLNAVIGLTQLTLETEIISTDARINMEKIYNAGSTLLSTVNDILDISKIEAGKLELILAEYDLSSMINDVITQSNIYIGEKPIKFELDITEDLPAKLYGDELRIKQIMNNLLSNACKYTREGTVGLSIRCSVETPAVLMNEIMAGTMVPPPYGTIWVTACVSDTGIGIKPENIKNLFNDYTQMDTESNRKIEGTGLGLSIVKKEVQMMGGVVIVKSEYGKGSNFTAIFQQKHVNRDTIGPEVVNNLKNFRYSISSRDDWKTRQARIDLSYAQVLVVDDNITNLDVAKGIMNLYGIKTDCVTTGQDAIDAIRRQSVKYNAIFMDHMMPGMDGIEATRIIREEIGTDYARNVPIIALTANAIIGNENLFLSKGFQAFISKPIEIDRLDAVIRQWVRDKELEKDLAGKRAGSGIIYPDMRRKKDRRAVSDRRSGIDRRSFGKVVKGVDLDKGLARFDNDEDIYLDVLRSFAKNTRPLLEQIKNPSSENLADYAVIVHGIKGSSRGIYAIMLGSRAEVLEKAAREGDLQFILTNNDEFINETLMLIDSIEEAQIKIIQGNKDGKEKPDQEILAKLLDSCNKYDVDGIDHAIEEMEEFVYSGDDGLVEWLRENVDQMNYQIIIDKLSKLINGGDDGREGNK
ncbi:MAG: ATP-binding protein [Treponema sp.]|nr:ATP-binding protein [Treponema sp.]